METQTGNGPGVLQVVLTLGAGGTERLVLEICKRLRPRVRMTVCALDEPGIWAGELQEHGIDVVALRRPPGFHPALGYRVAQVARRTRSSVLHCHHYSPFVYGRVAALVDPRLRVVFTEHGRLSDGPPSVKRRLVNPLLAAFRDPTFAVSGALRDSMIAEGFPAHRVGVVHNGIDPGPPPRPEERSWARRAMGLPSDAFVVGTVARLDPVKDLSTLIEAFAHFAAIEPKAALAIVGEGEERSRLDVCAAANRVAGRVRFLGQRDAARGLLAGFDVYVNSSVSEGVSLTILEAMAAERAVVATRVGGTPEVIADGVTGVLVPARDATALAYALRRLAAAPDYRAVLGAAARRAVLERFSIDRMVDRYAAEYRRLAAQGDERTPHRGDGQTW